MEAPSNDPSIAATLLETRNTPSITVGDALLSAVGDWMLVAVAALGDGLSYALLSAVGDWMLVAVAALVTAFRDRDRT